MRFFYEWQVASELVRLQRDYRARGIRSSSGRVPAASRPLPLAVARFPLARDAASSEASRATGVWHHLPSRVHSRGAVACGGWCDLDLGPSCWRKPVICCDATFEITTMNDNCWTCRVWRFAAAWWLPRVAMDAHQKQTAHPTRIVCHAHRVWSRRRLTRGTRRSASLSIKGCRHAWLAHVVG